MTLDQYLKRVEAGDGYCFNCRSWTMLGEVPSESENGLCPLCLTYHLCGSESNQVVDQLAASLG